MATMKSRHVNVTDNQHEAILAYADGKQVSFSEALRRIIDDWMDDRIVYHGEDIGEVPEVIEIDDKDVPF